MLRMGSAFFQHFGEYSHSVLTNLGAQDREPLRSEWTVSLFDHFLDVFFNGRLVLRIDWFTPIAASRLSSSAAVPGGRRG